MKQAWGSFTLRGTPGTVGSARWPRYDRTQLLMSLRAGGRSTTITDAAWAAQHRCAFWDGLGAPRAG
jgi:para-nitrobenzyl esterase